MKLGILVDSSSGINQKDLQGLNIDLIPLHIILEDGEEFLDTEENSDKYDLYSRLENGEEIKTSQASPGEIENKYNEMLKKYDHILHITITKNLSSMNQTAQMVANDDQFKGKVTILEHYMAANQIKYVALFLNDMINKGASLKEIVDTAKKADKEGFLGVIPGDLAKLARGGRAKALIIKLLNIIKTKVLIKWDEKPKSIAIGRTLNSLFPKLGKILNKTYVKIPYKIIALRTPHTSNKTAQIMRNFLDEIKADYIEEFVPNIYTAHAGVETLGIIVMPKKYLVENK